MNEDICFEWCFINHPKLLNYTYCDTVEECRKIIERQYRCSDQDYRILKKQIRVLKQNDKMKYTSVIVSEEEIPEKRKEKYGDKKGQRQRRSEQQDTTHQGRPPAKHLVLLLVE